jgi:predicted cation transporter
LILPPTPDPVVTAGLFAVFFIVLLGPFLIKRIERNLELFLFAMGVAAITWDTAFLALRHAPAAGTPLDIDPNWNLVLVGRALWDPVLITLAVLLAGLVFHYGRDRFYAGTRRAMGRTSTPVFVLLVVIALGLVSSIITAIIASLLLIEVITALTLSRRMEITIVVVACFSIGLGAALTPVGEPLATIVINTKLHADFWYLLREIGVYIIPGIIALGVVGALLVRRAVPDGATLAAPREEEPLKDVGIRAGKVYLFVVALVLLGIAFTPIIVWYIGKMGPEALFWVNTSSAILDNATLASAEIVRTMSQAQINSALMGLLVAGGMLIPGNIPNIISAGKLKITSKEWARIGVPLGMAMMIVYFVVLFGLSR